MTLFKSDIGKSIEEVEGILAEITERYQALSKPLKAIHRERSLSEQDAHAVGALKQFNFYPRLNHIENTFFEASQPVSYRFQRAAQLGAIHNSKKLPPRVVSVKGNSVRFAERVGLPVPESEYPLRLDEITFAQPCVIKPVHAEGGRCIYAFRELSTGEFRDDFSGRSFSSEQAVREAIRKEMKEVGVSKDAWLKEEVIVGSSGSPLDTFDVKMYTFYGSVGLILQVDRWHGRQYRFFNTEGEVVDTGKYSAEPDVDPVFDQSLIKVAEDVSRKIPWAHVRIDFLVSDTDWRFGEFTLRPGVAASFNQQWDRKLGDLYIKAQARLFEDLIMGKDFSDYRSLLPSS